MELNFGEPNSHKPQNKNTVNMEISNFDSSDLGFSGGNPTNFTAAACTSAGTMEEMREAVFRAAMMQPVDVDVESLTTPPGRKNVTISKDPRSVTSRLRRERISHQMRVLQRMVPDGTKMDTASMLDEAANYMRFLKRQVELLEQGSAQDYQPVMGDASFPDGGS